MPTKSKFYNLNKLINEESGKTDLNSNKLNTNEQIKFLESFSHIIFTNFPFLRSNKSLYIKLDRNTNIGIKGIYTDNLGLSDENSTILKLNANSGGITGTNRKDLTEINSIGLMMKNIRLYKDDTQSYLFDLAGTFLHELLHSKFEDTNRLINPKKDTLIVDESIAHLLSSLMMLKLTGDKDKLKLIISPTEDMPELRVFKKQEKLGVLKDLLFHYNNYKDTDSDKSFNKAILLGESILYNVYRKSNGINEFYKSIKNVHSLLGLTKLFISK